MRLIDADAMREEWLENGENKYVYDTNAVLDNLDQQPTIDAVPVVKAEWKYYKKQGIAVCTNCSFERNVDDNFGKAIACPNCGADMRKGDEE